MDETRGDEDDVREATVTSLAVGDACVVSVSVVRRSGDSAGRPENETATLQVPLAQHVDASTASTDSAQPLCRASDALTIALAAKKLFVRLLKKQKRPRAHHERDRPRRWSATVSLLTIVIEQTIDRTTSKAPRPPFGARSTRTARRYPEFARWALSYERDNTRGFPEILIQTPRSAGPRPPPLLARRARPGLARGFPLGNEGGGFPPPGWPPARGRVRGPPTWDRRRGAQLEVVRDGAFPAFRGETRLYAKDATSGGPVRFRSARRMRASLCDADAIRTAMSMPNISRSLARSAPCGVPRGTLTCPRRGGEGPGRRRSDDVLVLRHVVSRPGSQSYRRAKGDADPPCARLRFSACRSKLRPPYVPCFLVALHLPRAGHRRVRSSSRRRRRAGGACAWRRPPWRARPWSRPSCPCPSCPSCRT